MAVPNPPSLSAVYAEFGAPAGTPLSAFVRGGAWVPNIAANSNVPTSLPIRLSQLAGAVKYVPISINGPTTASIGSIPVARPPLHMSVSPSYSVSGGNASKSISWAKVSGSAGLTIDNTGSLNPTFTATGYVGNPPTNGGEEITSETWRLTVSDGTSSSTRDLTITVRRDTVGS